MAHDPILGRKTCLRYKHKSLCNQHIRPFNQQCQKRLHSARGWKQWTVCPYHRKHRMFGCLGRPFPSSARDLKRVLKAIPCSPMWGASNTRSPCRQAVESNIFARSYVLPLGALVYSTDCCRNTFLLMSTVCLQRQFSWTTVFLIEIRNGKHHWGSGGRDVIGIARSLM